MSPWLEGEPLQAVDIGDQAAVVDMGAARIDALHAAETGLRHLHGEPTLVRSEVERAQTAAVRAQSLIEAALQHLPARVVNGLYFDAVIGRRDTAVRQFVGVKPFPGPCLLDQTGHRKLRFQSRMRIITYKARRFRSHHRISMASP